MEGGDIAVLREDAARGPNRRERDGRMISVRVGIGDTGALVVGPNESGQFRRHVEIASLAQQPEHRGEMRSVCPVELWQRAIDKCSSNVLHFRVGMEFFRQGGLLCEILAKMKACHRHRLRGHLFEANRASRTLAANVVRYLQHVSPTTSKWI
jgi:hypothetical protein